MGRYLHIAVYSILVLAIAACGSEEQSSNPTPSNTPSVPKTAVVPTFKNPVVPAKKTSNFDQPTANLIPSTNAEQRAGTVLKGRTDPFGQIVGPYPTQVHSSTVVPARPVPVLPPLRPQAIVKRPSFVPPVRTTTTLRPSIPSVVASSTKRNLLSKPKNKIALTPKNKIALTPKNKIALTPKKAKPPRVFTPVLPSVLPQVIPNQTLASVLPPAPQPELARAVLVKGIVLVGKEAEAIIKVPTEPNSRYVQPGQRLANGVLIKRIEMNEGSNPVVILEQYGIEVARMVGEGPSPTPPPTASGVNPALTTPLPPSPVPTGAT